MSNIRPEHPDDAGLRTVVPDAMQLEGAELLANQARSRLRSRGFTDQEIDEWALTYISLEHSGDVEGFIEWIRQKEANDDHTP